jgi:hypothetical protein
MIRELYRNRPPLSPPRGPRRCRRVTGLMIRAVTNFTGFALCRTAEKV